MADVTVKGSGIRPAVDWIRQKYGDQLWETMLDSFDAEDRATLSILNTGLTYPIALFDSVLVSFAHTALQDDRTLADRDFREMGAFAAGQGLTGLFSVFLKFGSPEGTFRRVGSLLPMVYSGIENEIDIGDVGDEVHAMLTIRGLGDLSYAGPRLCGFGEEGLKRSGLETVRIEEHSWTSGLIKADPLVFEARWPKR